MRGVNRATLQPSLEPVTLLPYYEGHMKRAASGSTILKPAREFGSVHGADLLWRGAFPTFPDQLHTVYVPAVTLKQGLL